MSLSQKDILLSGSFSGAGKLSLNQYNIITQANRLKRKEQKINRKYFIIPNYALPVYSEENTVIHSTNFQVKKFLEEDNNKDNSSINSIQENENENEEKKVFQGENYKYYNLHQKRIKYDKKNGIKKKKNEYSYTPGVYNINNNYYNKIKGIGWKNLAGRKDINIVNNNKNEIETYISKDITKRINIDKSKGFIDMSKQTERRGFPSHSDLRQRCEKKFVPINPKLQKMNWIKFCKKPLIPVSPFSNDTYEIFGYRTLSSPNIKNNDKNITKIKLKNISSQTNSFKDINKKKIKFPSLIKYRSTLDFNKSLNNKNIFKTEEKLRKPICILYPNYNAIEERVKMMVVYNNNNKTSNDTIKRKNRMNEFKGINLNDLYDASKTYEKIYGHKFSCVPNFEKMISRPNDEKLPSFMKGIYNGMSLYLNTDKILNNCTDRNENKNQMKRQKLNNIFLRKKNDNKRKKHNSKEILKKFNNLYINYYKSLNKNK